MARLSGFFILLLISQSIFAQEQNRSFFMPWYSFSGEAQAYLAVYGIQQLSETGSNDSMQMHGQFAFSEQRDYFTDIHGDFGFADNSLAMQLDFYMENWQHNYFSHTGPAVQREHYRARSINTNARILLADKIDTAQQLFFALHHRKQGYESKPNGLLEQDTPRGFSGASLLGLGFGNISQYHYNNYSAGIHNTLLLYNKRQLSEYQLFRFTAELKQQWQWRGPLSTSLHSLVLLQQGDIPYGMQNIQGRDQQYWFAGAPEGRFRVNQAILNRLHLNWRYSEQIGFGGFLGQHIVQWQHNYPLKNYGVFIHYKALPSVSSEFSLQLARLNNHWSILLNLQIPWRK